MALETSPGFNQVVREDFNNGIQRESFTSYKIHSVLFPSMSYIYVLVSCSIRTFLGQNNFTCNSGGYWYNNTAYGENVVFLVLYRTFCHSLWPQNLISTDVLGIVGSNITWARAFVRVFCLIQ